MRGRPLDAGRAQSLPNKHSPNPTTRVPGETDYIQSRIVPLALLRGPGGTSGPPEARRGDWEEAEAAACRISQATTLEVTEETTMRLFLWSLGVVGLVVLLGSPVSAHSFRPPNVPVGDTQIEVIPQKPTSSDNLSIRVFGQWSDSCVPQTSRVSMDGSRIFIDLSIPPLLRPCLLVITAWEDTVSIGQLPAGIYHVMVRFDGSTIGEGLFTVVPPPVGGTASFLADDSGTSGSTITTLTGIAVGALAILAAGGWYARRRRRAGRSS